MGLDGSGGGAWADRLREIEALEDAAFDPDLVAALERAD